MNHSDLDLLPPPDHLNVHTAHAIIVHLCGTAEQTDLKGDEGCYGFVKTALSVDVLKHATLVLNP